MTQKDMFKTMSKSTLKDWLGHQFEEKGDAFYVVDLKKIEAQFKLWKTLLPEIKPFYAVKCNPDTEILALLYKLGAGFDCASQGEIELVRPLGVKPEEIIFANPCKHPKQIDFAEKNNIHTYTFDCIEELEKIQKIDPRAKLVLRIKTDDSNSLCQFSTKFGAEMSEVPAILEMAQNLQKKTGQDFALIGVSFHVGSGCKDAYSYEKALMDAKKIFQMAKSYGFELNLLDIGGGFPGFEGGSVSFEEIAACIQNTLKREFSSYKNLTIIGEPGRFMVANSHTLYVNVTSKKQKIDPLTQTKSFVYYINEAVYASFNCLFFDHYIPLLKPLIPSEKTTYLSTIFGQTCDSMDKIAENIALPELSIGDWIQIDNFGAYTTAPASTFNGFPLAKKYYVLE